MVSCEAGTPALDCTDFWSSGPSLAANIIVIEVKWDACAHPYLV